jgi:hypothetical protein
MVTYKSIKEGKPVDKKNIGILKKATEEVAFFTKAVLEIQNKKKSLLVIYKG